MEKMTIETNPSANAVRHGLVGTRHVWLEHRAFVKNIEKDLVDLFRPELLDEQERERKVRVPAIFRQVESISADVSS